MTPTAPAFSVSGLTKSFGTTRALSDVTLSIPAGSIHGIVGANGAGKSTLLKILTGIHHPDAGTLERHGRPYAPRDPFEAQGHGVALIPQELRVVSQMTVADNVMLGNWPSGTAGGPLARADGREAARRAREILGRLGIDLDPHAEMGTLHFAEAQSVVIARVLSRNARILILDEPTAALNREETEALFALVKRLRDDGVTILYVSHRLAEVEELCDAVTVFRDGRIAANFRREEYSLDDLETSIAGASVEELKRTDSAPASDLLFAAPVAGGRIEIRTGRVTALHGLLGSGIGGFMRAIFGADPGTRNPAAAIAEGMGYVPSERFRAIVPALSIRDNILLPHLADFRRFGRLDGVAMDRVVVPLIERIGIRPADPGLKAGGLSGGNQQKVLFARWLYGGTRTLLLDEPTHGIDIGAKARIRQAILDFAERGGGVLIHSVEWEDLAGIADDLLEMHRGQLIGRQVRTPQGWTQHPETV